MTHGTERTGRTLPDAMGYLVASTAPQPWRESVARVAQFLTPGWDDLRGQGSQLGTLATTLYIRAYERQQPAAEVPVEVVKEALEYEEHPHNKEPYQLQQRMDAALKTTGQFRSSPDSREWHETPVCRVYRDLIHVWYPEEMTSAWAPGPTEMYLAVYRLQEALAQLDEDRATLLPEAPEPTGAIRITVTGWVRNVRYGGASGASIPINRDHCDAMDDGTLTADGPDATYTCANGHTRTRHNLSAPRIRHALSLCFDPEDSRVAEGLLGDHHSGGRLQGGVLEHAYPMLARFL
ncbi:hypothetical protein ABZ419_19045 [Streptomyces cinnamoneus]|uniref:hypothetical protein n=1 Tax=Streptomyces cinnamoneus TaxID=53446 RepID=UPI00340A063E